jgi:hypothetical protein
VNNFDPSDFFKDDQSGDVGRMGRTAGSIGAWILHLAKVTFLLYSGAHAINATLNFAGSSDWAKAAQIVGIVTLEAVLLGIYLAWHNGKITGPAQSVTAGVTYAVGFTLACLGIVADSQINAGVTMAGWLVWYLTWGLPIAPAVMAAGAILTSELAQEKLRQREQSNERAALEDEEFKAALAIQRAELKEAQTLRGMQLASRQAVLSELHRVYTSPDVQKAIASTAVNNAPALLKAAGIHVEDGRAVTDNGEMDLEDLVDYLVAERLKQEWPSQENVTYERDDHGRQIPYPRDPNGRPIPPQNGKPGANGINPTPPAHGR